MTKGTAEIMLDSKSTGKKMTMSETVREVLLRARDDKRLTCGLYESGVMLETNPDAVMLCVLPTNKFDDVTLDIHYTLIEAFCLENEISLMKVDGVDKLTKLLGDSLVQNPTTQRLIEINDNYDYGDSQSDSLDFNCILVEEPTKKHSDCEQSLIEYYKDANSDMPQLIVDLDV